MGVAGAGAAVEIGRKRAEKIVKHQEGGRGDRQCSQDSSRR
jgi:hypothetical protein